MVDHVTAGSSVEYPVYADHNVANAYLDGSASAAADAWRAITDNDVKARYLISMTRTLDRQRWKGDKTEADQELAWPRTNTGVDGVEDTVIPQAIIDACCEGAAMLADGADFESTQNQSQKIQSLGAGSARLSYFRGAEGPAYRFPLVVQELVGPYLASTGLSLTGVVSGVDEDVESVTAQDFGLNQPL